MDKDTALLVTPSVPLSLDTAVDGDQETSPSGDTSNNKTETGHCTRPKTQRKPGMSKVILRAVADKGVHNRVSLIALKKAVATTGYNMAHNTWRFKRALKNLVNKGMLKQVTGKGALGSFRLGKKQAFKSKLKAKRRQRKQQRRRRSRERLSGQGRSGQRRSRQGRSGQRPSPLGSRKGHKRLSKGRSRVAKGHRN